MGLRHASGFGRTLAKASAPKSKSGCAALRRFGFILCLLSLPAWAVLGQSAASLKTDQAVLHSRWTMVRHATYTVARLHAPDGLSVEEYISPAGFIFGLQWRGPHPPDMSALLGAYFAEYRHAASSLRRHFGPWILTTAHLTISMSGHMRAFRGSAWVNALLPPGMRLAGSRLVRNES